VSSIGQGFLSNAVDGLPLDQSHLDAQRLTGTDAAAIQAAFAQEIQPDDFVRVIEGP